jgi:hypothetical protein
MHGQEEPSWKDRSKSLNFRIRVVEGSDREMPENSDEGPSKPTKLYPVNDTPKAFRSNKFSRTGSGTPNTFKSGHIPMQHGNKPTKSTGAFNLASPTPQNQKASTLIRQSSNARLTSTAQGSKRSSIRINPADSPELASNAFGYSLDPNVAGTLLLGLNLKNPQLLETDKTAEVEDSPRKYFYSGSKKTNRDREMVKVENRIFCSDWERATKVVMFETEKLKKMLYLPGVIKPLDDVGRYTLFEAIANCTFYSTVQELGGSLLDFGFQGKVDPKILGSHGFSLYIYDVTNLTYCQMLCKPSITYKTIFLDDVTFP